MPSHRVSNPIFRGPRGAILAIVILAVCAVVAGLLEPPPVALSGRITASDGDSFRYGSERLRLLGMDAPELAQTCVDGGGAQWACGHVAREQLGKLLHGKLSCQQQGNDRYGRILSRCLSGETDIGAAMVAQGMAISSGDYGREEATARSARRGIWAGSFEDPKTWRDQHPRSNLLDL